MKYIIGGIVLFFLITAISLSLKSHLVSNKIRCEWGYQGKWLPNTGMTGKGICAGSIINFGSQSTGRVLFEGDEDYQSFKTN